MKYKVHLKCVWDYERYPPMNHHPIQNHILLESQDTEEYETLASFMYTASQKSMQNLAVKRYRSTFFFLTKPLSLFFNYLKKYQFKLPLPPLLLLPPHILPTLLQS